jgi:hypothetical protein
MRWIIEKRKSKMPILASAVQPLLHALPHVVVWTGISVHCWLFGVDVVGAELAQPVRYFQGTGSGIMP